MQEWGRHPSVQILAKAYNKTDSKKSNNKGEKPIEKNVRVIDKDGNEYEATYPKRAKGLVKKGRARFVDENTICLACPPDMMEDTKMSDNINEKLNAAVDAANVNAPAKAEATKNLTQTTTECLESRETPAEEKAMERFTPEYIMAQIEKLLAERIHITSVLNMFSSEDDSNFYGDVGGRVKYTAIADMVKCRETTIQQALNFYEKMYEEVKPSPMDIAMAQAERILNAPAYASCHSPETKAFHARDMFNVIMEVFTANLRGQQDKDTSKAFKKDAIMQYVSQSDEYMAPQELAEYLAILDK